MKKLIVLVTALLLVSMAAMADHEAVMAEGELVVTSEIEMRWLNDISNKEYQGDKNEVILKLDWTAENITAYIEFEEDASGVDEGANGFDRAHFTVDLGAIFGLPVGLTVLTGYEEYKLFDDVKVTEGEWEDTIGSNWKSWGHQVDVGIGEMVDVLLIWPNNPKLEGLGAGIAVDYAPLFVEVGYIVAGKESVEDPAGVLPDIEAENGDSIGYGDIEVGVEFAMDDVATGIDVAAALTLDYDLLEGDYAESLADGEYAGDTQWTIGAAGAVTYNDMYTLGIAWKGVQDAESGGIQVDVTAALMEGLEANLFAGIGLDEDTYPETFDSLEASLNYKLGLSSWTAGVLYLNDGSGAIAKEKAEYTPAETDGVSIFMRAELKL